MKRLVLHIGYPKNGSSALQVALRRNAGVLSEAGIGYPVLDRREVQAIARRGFGSGNAVFLVEALRKGEPLWPLTRRVEAAREEVVILSTEAFGRLDVESRKPLLAWLRGLHVPLRIVAYRRDPYEMALSGYMQTVKAARGVHPLARSCSRFNDPQEIIRAVFEDFEVEERSFAEARGDLENDFLQWVAPGAPRIARPAMPVNRSLSREEVEMVIRLNRSALPQREIDGIVAEILRGKMQGEKLRHDAASIRALSLRLGRDPRAEMWRLERGPGAVDETGGAAKETALRTLDATLAHVAGRLEKLGELERRQRGAGHGQRGMASGAG